MKNGVPGVNGYQGLAGGWGAAKAVTVSVFSQKVVVRGTIVMSKMNQAKEFDCSGCAWPDPGHRAPMGLCEDGVKAVFWETTSKEASPEFFSRHPASISWHRNDYELENIGRLTHSMKYDAMLGTWRAADWDLAFREIGEHLRSYDSTQQVKFYASGRTSNETAFLYQLLAHEYGNSNFPDYSNMCHGPTNAGLTPAIGLRKGTVELDDFDHCNLAIYIGHNSGTNHPRTPATLRDAARRGAKIISINPLNEGGFERFSLPQNAKETFTGQVMKLSNDYYQIEMGRDASLLKGTMKALIEMDEARILLGQWSTFDHALIDQHTAGYTALCDDSRQHSQAELEWGSGLTHSQMEDLVHSHSKPSVTIVCCGLGITQHKNGTGNIQQPVNLLLLKDNMGKPGVGICPLRGRSDVQGDRSVGTGKAASEDFLQRLGEHFSVHTPCKHDRSSVESTRTVERGDARALIHMGGNPAIAMPQLQRISATIKGLDLQVYVATKLNRSHLLPAKYNYLLPTLGRTEHDMQTAGIQSVTIEDFMSMVHASCGAPKPASRWLGSEPATVAGMARATLPRSPINWGAFTGDYALIHDVTETVIPAFHDYNVRIAKPGRFCTDTPASCREWQTVNGEVDFTVSNQRTMEREHRPADALVLATLCSYDQYSITIYGMNGRYRGITDRRDVVFLNVEEVMSRDLSQGDVVNAQALDDNGQPCADRIMYGLTVVIYNMAAGPIGTYLPEASVLLSLDAIDTQSSTPVYKSVPVTLAKAQFLL